MAKRVVILVRRAPLAHSATTEAVRIALGQTLADHAVTLLYIDDGAGAAGALKPELTGGEVFDEALALLEACNVRQAVEQSSLTRARIGKPRAAVEVIDRAAALALINGADVLVGL